jgi:NAD(P)-dependent dehydrogenase (short-subunit alcohol dehydrogenase family)
MDAMSAAPSLRSGTQPSLRSGTQPSLRSGTQPLVVLVTGGGRGLGRTLVGAFADNGYRVAACGRNTPEPGSIPAEFFPCDVRDPDQVAGMVDAVVEKFERIDILINNAGGTPYAAAAEMSPRLFEKVVALNLLAPFYVAQRANAVMQRQDEGGVIINIGSVVSIRPSESVAPYVAAKAGLGGLTRALALEWAPKVRVNQITSGLLRTDLVDETYGPNLAGVEATVPMGRLAHGEDVAAACLMLAQPALAYTTGADLLVDGGGEFPAWLIASKQTS